MLEFYVESDVRLRQLRQCPAGRHMDGLADWLHAAGYKRRPGQLVLRGAAHLAHWASARGGPIDRIDEGVLHAFADHLRTCACPSPFRGRDRYHRDGAQRLLTHLRRVGVLPPPNAEAETVPPLVTRFSQWMRQHRGVTESTLANYVPLVTEFMTARGDNVATYDAAGVRAFIFDRASRYGHSRAKSTINAIRMFLRFLAVSGSCSSDLAGAVPRIAEWKLASLPRYISADDIERVLATCDPTTATGARDRAIILLLARLGLRAGGPRDRGLPPHMGLYALGRKASKVMEQPVVDLQLEPGCASYRKIGVDGPHQHDEPPSVGHGCTTTCSRATSTLA